MKIESNHGFTVLESLLVLSFSLVLIGLPTIITQSVYEQLESTLFLESFQSRLNAMQNYALLMNQKTTIAITQSKAIDFEVPAIKDSSFNTKLLFPKNMQTMKSYTIHYKKGTGRPTTIQTIIFKDNQKTYYFKFQMGSGRYIYEEVS